MLEIFILYKYIFMTIYKHLKFLLFLLLLDIRYIHYAISMLYSFICYKHCMTEITIRQRNSPKIRKQLSTGVTRE